MSLSRFGIAAVLSCLALPAPADTFTVKLGKTTLGTLTHEIRSGRQDLTSTLRNTPFGVFNGTFVGTSSGGRSSTFVGISRSSRKSRQVTVRFKASRAVETDVTPPEELTALSDPAAAPAGVVDPVRAVGGLLTARNGCPGAQTIYDGRRAIALRPTGGASEGGTLTCDISYRVVAGPGHLSPLNVSRARMQLTYDTSRGGQTLIAMQLGTGPFKVVLSRID